MRAPQANERVYVYWNLHKHLWSIKALEGADKGRVICHADSVMISDATFKVSEAARQTVLRTQQRSVHAGVVGRIGGALSGEGEAFSYNPYKAGHFYRRSDGSAISGAAAVTFQGDRTAKAYGAR